MPEQGLGERGQRDAMDQGKLRIRNSLDQLEGSLPPLVTMPVSLELWDKVSPLRAAGQDLLVLVDQKQRANGGGGFMQQPIEPLEQHIYADDPHQHLVLHYGLRQGNHLALPGKIFVGARYDGALAGVLLFQGILPVRFQIDGAMKAKLAGGDPGVEIDKVIYPGEVEPGNLVPQQFAGGGEQGRQTERQMQSGFSLAARGRQSAQPGQIAAEPGGQVGGNLVQRESLLRICVQGLIKLASQRRLRIAAQPLLGLATHGLEHGFHLLELGSQTGGHVEGIALVEFGDLFQSLMEGEGKQQYDEGTK